MRSALDSHDQVVRDMRSAKSLYILKCSGCHGVDGTGAPAAGIPSFPGFIAPLARHAEGRVYIAHVPGIVGSRLSNEQLVKVLNYVIDEWSGEEDASSTPRFTVEELADLRAVPVTNVVAYRRDVVAQMKQSGEPVADYPWP
jgi:mono/diheme cytochrome c family protein